MLKCPVPICELLLLQQIEQIRLHIELLLLGSERCFPHFFCPERERVRGPMPVAVAVVAFVFGIVRTSTRSKPKLAVKSLGVSLLTHYCAVRIDKPKTEHIPRNKNA